MVLTMRLLTCTALACLWRIPGREFTETTDFVVQLKGRVQFPQVNTGLLTEGLEVSFQIKKRRFRIGGIRSGPVQNLAAMSGLLYTRMTGELMMVPGLITSIGVCFGCIRVRYLKDVSR